MLGHRPLRRSDSARWQHRGALLRLLRVVACACAWACPRLLVEGTTAPVPLPELQGNWEGSEDSATGRCDLQLSVSAVGGVTR